MPPSTDSIRNRISPPDKTHRTAPPALSIARHGVQDGGAR